MLLFCEAKITVDKDGKVRVKGVLEKYSIRISQFVHDLNLRSITITRRWGRFSISGEITPFTRQRLLNFLANIDSY